VLEKLVNARNKLSFWIRNYIDNRAFKSVYAASYIEALEQTIRLLREQISSLERDKLWLHEMLEKSLAPVPVLSASPSSEESEAYDLLNLNTSHELPSERRRRLQEKHRKRVESNE